MTELRIEETAGLDDPTLDALTRLLVACVDDGASIGFLAPLDPDEARRYWRGVCGPDVVLIVARREERVVGTAQLHLGWKPNARHRAEVVKVLVHPDVRRQGIGRRLVEELERLARREGRRLLYLDTRAGDPANDLYVSLGYVRAGRIPNWCRDPHRDVLDATVFYYKELS